MSRDSIVAYCRRRGWPMALASAWRRRGIVRWTPLQLQALAAGIDRPDAGDWLVAAPTSSGKSLVAEVAILGRLFSGEQALWLVPTRSLAESISADLRTRLGPLGLRVEAASGDHRENDEAAGRGDFDLLVAVYEKGLQWLARRPDALARVGIVVADELGMLRDPERGGRLDLLLTLIAASPYSPRRLGLSAPGETAALAAWQGGRVLESNDRPRPLHEGTLDAATGRFRWRDRRANGAAAEGSDALFEPAAWNRTVSAAAEAGAASPSLAATLAAASLLAERCEPTLLFAPSRAAARSWARGLAALSSDASDAKTRADFVRAADRLARREPCGDHALLADLMRAGTAFHQADLSPPARRLVEEAFISGAIQSLVATATLAHGINLTAVNVLQWPRVWRGCGEAGAGETPLERWRWREQGGRAARLGLGEGRGRSIAAVADEAEAERFWRRYIQGSSGPLRGGLTPAGVGPAIMAALAAGEGRTERNLAALVKSSFGACSAGGEREGGQSERLVEALAASIDEQIASGLIALPPDGRPENTILRLAPLGRNCALRGIEPEVWRRLKTLAALDPNFSLTDGDDASMIPAIWGLALAAPPGFWPASRPAAAASAIERAREWFAARETPAPPTIAARLDPDRGADPRAAGAIEAGWRLARWIGPDPTPEVERATGWSAGMLQRAGEGVAWLAFALAEAGILQGWSAERARAWRTLGTRLATGAPARGIEIARMGLSELGRTGLRRLCAEGIESGPAILGLPFAKLARVVQSRELARRLKGAAERNADYGASVDRFGISEVPVHFNQLNGASAPAKVIESKKEHSVNINANDSSNDNESHLVSPFSAPCEFEKPDPEIDAPLLEIDLQSPGMVRLAGRELALAPLGWDLLAALAETPGRVLTREALCARLWPEEEAAPQPQQLDAHRRRLTQRLAPAFRQKRGELIQVVRGIGLRLNLAETEIALRRG